MTPTLRHHRDISLPCSNVLNLRTSAARGSFALGTGRSPRRKPHGHCMWKRLAGGPTADPRVVQAQVHPAGSAVRSRPFVSAGPFCRGSFALGTGRSPRRKPHGHCMWKRLAGRPTADPRVVQAQVHPVGSCGSGLVDSIGPSATESGSGCAVCPLPASARRPGPTDRSGSWPHSHPCTWRLASREIEKIRNLKLPWMDRTFCESVCECLAQPGHLGTKGFRSHRCLHRVDAVRRDRFSTIETRRWAMPVATHRPREYRRTDGATGQAAGRLLRCVNMHPLHVLANVTLSLHLSENAYSPGLLSKECFPGQSSADSHPGGGAITTMSFELPSPNYVIRLPSALTLGNLSLNQPLLHFTLQTTAP